MTERRPIVIANWKLNGGIDLICSSVVSFMRQHFEAQIAIAPPYIYIRDLHHFLSNSEIFIGSQNVSKYESGAYTGETSAQMLKEAGSDFCIVGHSERREMFHENDASCNIKIASTLKADLMAIFCVGENNKQREAGITKDVLNRQLHEALTGQMINGQDLCVAYEPVWAIGTGLAATPETAQEVHAYIREELVTIFGEELAKKVRILYGGSVNKNNAADLFAMPDIDGFLVGGASLDPEHFSAICLQADASAQS